MRRTCKAFFDGIEVCLLPPSCRKIKNPAIFHTAIMTIVRTAEPSDVAQLAALLEELFAIEADFTFDRDKQIQGLKQLLVSEKDGLFVAESDRRVVGMCSLQTLISTAEGGPVGLVEDLIVTEAFRHRASARNCWPRPSTGRSGEDLSACSCWPIKTMNRLCNSMQNRPGNPRS